MTHRLRHPDPRASRARRRRTRSSSSPAATCATPPTALAGRPSRSSRRTSRPPWRSMASGCAAPTATTRRSATASSGTSAWAWTSSPSIHPDAPVIVAEAVWEYSHHVLAGLRTHRGPILTVANWSGQWPGLVGLLNLNASHDQGGHGLQHHLERGLHRRLRPHGHQGVGRPPGRITPRHVARARPRPAHPAGQARPSWAAPWPPSCSRTRPSWASSTKAAWACTTPSSTTSSSTRWASTRSASASRRCTPRCARSRDDGGRGHLRLAGRPRHDASSIGTDEETELTEAQVLQQLQDVHRRPAHRRRLRLRRHRHPVPAGPQGPRAGLRPGRGPAQQRRPAAGLRRERRASCTRAQPLPHFNEVDWGAGVDALITNRVWTAMGLDPSTTLHDVRWGDPCGRRLRVGLRDLRLGAAVAPDAAATPGPSASASRPCTSPSAAAPSRASASPGRSSGAASS